MKRKELLWMILPCLLLVGVGFALRGRHSAILPWNEPFAIVVEKVEKERLTPREVADGWDTKLKITLTHKGWAPPWWGQLTDGASHGSARFFYENKGKQSAVKMPRGNRDGDYFLWNPRWDEESQRYVAQLLMPLAKVPPHPGSVKAQARLAFEKGGKPLCPPLRWEHVVRRPGEVVKVPAVSKNTHLRLEEVIVQDVPPIQRKVEYAAGDTQVIWKVRYSATGVKTSYSLGIDAQIYDEHGTTYSDSGTSAGVVSVEMPNSTCKVDLDLKSIPRRAGALTLRGKIGLGSHWPLTVEVPIRDKQGRILKTPRAPAPFTISSIEVRPASDLTKKELGWDTAVVISTRFKQPKKHASESNSQRYYENWRTDWSPHLVDEKGKEYWAFKTPYPVGPQPLGGGVSYEGDRTSIDYAIPLNQVPSKVKTLRLKTQIGYKHSALVPVEVIVRQNGVTQFTSQEPWS